MASVGGPVSGLPTMYPSGPGVAKVMSARSSFAGNPFGNGAFITGSQSASTWLINAGLTLNGPDKSWALSLECTNCLNESYIQSALSNYSYLNQPMKWDVRARYNF